MDYDYVFQIGTQNGPTLSLSYNIPTRKKTTPRRNKDQHGPSLHISFCQNVTFGIVFTIIRSLFGEKTTFLNDCHILVISCISGSKVGDPKLLLLVLFQDRTLISKVESYPKGISIFYLFISFITHLKDQ